MHSKLPSTSPYPESDWSSSYFLLRHFEDPSEYYPPIYSCVFQVGSSSQVSPPKPCINFSVPIRSTCPLPSHSSSFLISGNMSGENYRSLNSSLYSFLHRTVTTSLLGPNILLNTLFSNTHFLGPSQWEQRIFSNLLKEKRLQFFYLNHYTFVKNAIWEKNLQRNNSKHYRTSICS